MRIAIDLTSLSDNFSGLERCALELSLALIAHADKMAEFVLVVKNHIPSCLTDVRRKRNVRCVRIKGRNKLLANQITLPLTMYRIPADVYIFPAFPVPLLFMKKNSYGCIADMGCFDCPQTMKFRQRLFFRAGARHSAKVCKKIYTVSNFSRERITALLRMAPQRVMLLYNAVRKIEVRTRQRAAVREKYGLPPHYYLSLCTLEPRKNLKLLIKAYTELAAEGAKLPALVLAGRKGWMMEDNLCEEESIIFPGFIEEEDLPALYAAAECFIFPSLYEGFGLPPLEASACGCRRIICSDTPALIEVMGNTAVYFENNNKASLKNALRSLPAVQPAGEKAVEENLSRFSWEKSAEILWREINE